MDHAIMIPTHQWDHYRAQEVNNARTIAEYLRDAKINYQTLSPETRTQLDAGAARYLYANNSRARIDFARIAVTALMPVIDRMVEKREKLMFVSLVPYEEALPIAEAHTFDPKKFAAWAREVMGGLNYLGMIEPGYYPRHQLDPLSPKGTISWHGHALVWGKTEAELAVKFGPLDASRSMLHLNPAVHIKPISPEIAPSRALYCLKSPEKSYTSWMGWGQRADPNTGELSWVPVGKQRAVKLRSGERIKLCEVLREQYLDRLLISGGEGSIIARAIVDKALAPLHADEDRAEDQSARR